VRLVRCRRKNINDSSTPPVLVLVPAFNAAGYLPRLITRLREYVCHNNLLIVNDGSTDATIRVLRELNVHFLSFRDNRGKGAALAAGFRYAIARGYRSVLTIDADLQHLPEEIPGFLALDDGHTVVIGTRNISLSQMPPPRCLTNWLTSIIVSIFSGQRVRDSQSGFRLLPTTVLRSLPLRTVGYDFESELLFKSGALGCRIAEVPVSTVYEGASSYINPLMDTLRFVRQIWRRIWY